MNNYFTDSHAHLTCDLETFKNVKEILERAIAANVKQVITIYTTLESLERALSLKEKYPFIGLAASITPHDVEAIGEKSFQKIAEEAKKGSLVAVGETGLDYHYAHSKPEIQKDFLRRYLHLSLECKLPVVIHCREAFKDFFEILDEEYRVNGKHAPGVLHCFTGTMQEAKEVLKRDFYLSLSGIVTFKKSIDLQEVAKMVPLEQLLIETDTPFLAPQNKRGKKNEPAYLPEIAECIAHLKQISKEEVMKATTENANRLFRYKEIGSS